MKHIYVADDGKRFNDPEACMEYENKLNEEEKERKRKEEERERRFKELEDAWNNFETLSTKYYQDYPSTRLGFPWDSFFVNLMR